MKPCVGTLVACLVGYVVATGAAGDHSGLVDRRSGGSSAGEKLAVRDDNVSMDGMKFETVTVPNNYVFQQRIHGTAQQVDQFVEHLTLSQLKQILGPQYGNPFRITFLENTTGAYLGYIAGYFTSDGGIAFDPASQIPGGVSLPKIQKQPSLAPAVTTITLNGGQSSKVIADGKVTSGELAGFLGADYGKPFKLILTDGTGKNIGFVSGSFSSTGPQFDADSYIPKPAATKAPPPPPPKTTDSGSETSASGSAAGGAPAGSHTGAVTLSVTTPAQVKSMLNNLSYDYILNAVGGKYGPFYITFSTPDGSLKGYIKGTISPSDYSYQWSYTYQS